MSSIYGDDTSHYYDDQGSGAHEEKIFVAVRLRPLNEREISHNDVSDWECINNSTILYKNSLSERSLFPTAASYDRVFGSECSTEQVYEEAAKGVALSVLNGINSSIFAYGQTSSGKTYTMSGITEYTLADIYDTISKSDDREFTLKFSAMEIYNEVVRDLLSPECTPLRLLDDPERGTVVEKLTDVTLRDWNHLKELLSVCEAQRKIGETALNEMSSRSHQILRLTVESSAKKYVGFQNSSTLTASVNFVDLAGSERASQTLSANVRLKEGSHINRSLLTLGTVIRKLSSKKGNGHVPFRDSKLTRILQNSLGGNARTAIICTMSPAHSHVEQSRNTLLFATCAKQVTTNAKVNIVMSEKALVKQLRKELARLEAELRNLSALAASGGSVESLKEKELLIEKMSREIRELTEQRDQAQSRVHNLAGSGSWTELSRVSSPDKALWMDEYAASEVSECVYPFRSDSISAVSQNAYEDLNSNKLGEQIPELAEDQFLSNDTSPRMFLEKYFGPDPCKGWENIAQQRSVQNSEDNCKEVQCVEVDSDTNITSSDKQEELKETNKPTGEQSSSSDTDSNNLPRSESSENITTDMPVFTGSEIVKEKGDIACESEELCTKNEKASQPELSAESVKVLTKEPSNRCFTIEVKLKMSGEDCEKICTEELKVSGEDSEKICAEAEAEDKEAGSEVSPSRQWTEFEKQMQEIIELWNACNVPLVHRTYFFLLFKGDPNDSVYMEVELRRLSYLKNAFSLGAKVVKDGQIFSQAASLSALNREKAMLSKLLLKKFSSKERDELYQKWGIALKTKKRRHQLCNKLWKDTKDMDHIKDSSALISKLVGFQEQTEVPKEMFELNFSPGPKSLSSFSWKPTSHNYLKHLK